MNLNKFFILISLLLVLFVSVSVVSATGNADMGVNEVVAVESSIMNEEMVVEGGVHNSSEIYDEIKNATGTYNITADYGILETWEIINDNVIIEGNNHTIYGYGNQAFKISGDNVTIKNLKFVGSKKNVGGAMVFFKNGFVSGCSFTDCSAGYGGAITFSGSGSVSGCSFVRCSATSYDGGAIWFHNGGSVSGCSFVRCSASRDGGAIYFSGSGSVSGCSFVRCSAGGAGGALYLHFCTWVSVSGSTFVNCSAIKEGGAIRFEGDGNINYCVFENNIAKYGGAFYASRGVCNTDYNFFAFKNNVARFPASLVFPSVNNWVVLKSYNSDGNYYVKFVNNNGSDLDGFMPDYTASLEKGSYKKNIIIHNNMFSCEYDPTISYTIYSLNTGELLISLPPQGHTPPNVRDINKSVSNKINDVGNCSNLNCGTPLLALFIALISLPIIRRRK